MIDWDERPGKTSLYRFITPDISVRPDKAGSPDGFDAKPLTDSCETSDQNVLRTDKQITEQNDDVGGTIKEVDGADSKDVLDKASEFLRDMGVSRRLRQEFVSTDAALAAEWSKVDWPRQYPEILNPTAFLITALRDGLEPAPEPPGPPETTKRLDCLSKESQEIVRAAWEAMKHRGDRSIEKFVEDGWPAISRLCDITTAKEVSDLLAFADAWECRNTAYEGIRSLQYFERVFHRLKDAYVASGRKVAQTFEDSSMRVKSEIDSDEQRSIQRASGLGMVPPRIPLEVRLKPVARFGRRKNFGVSDSSNDAAHM
ncbi:MAG: hypothetical protein WB615_01090 [Candidatus Tumulicola sp.]